MYEFIKERLKDLGKKQKQLAEAVGIQPPHLSAIFNGIRRIQANEVAPMARFLGIDVEEFAKYIANQNKQMIPLALNSIRKVGYVQAGKFNEACQLPEAEWETIPYPINDQYKNCHLYALGVRGDSMNLVFPPDTTTLICCPFNEWIEANPDTEIEGKYIIAYRKDISGGVEATVKKYTKIDDATIILVAESSNPDIKPIVLHPDNNEYDIAAVVIGDIRMY